ERGTVRRMCRERVLPRPDQFTCLPAGFQIDLAGFFVGGPHDGGFVEARLRCCDLRVEARERELLSLRRQGERRAPGSRAAVGYEACLLDVGEERLHRVEVRREERVELVVVTLRTSQRAAEPDGAQRADAICAVFGEVFPGLKPAFSRRAIEAIVGRCDALLDGGLRQQVSGDLLPRELADGPR